MLAFYLVVCWTSAMAEFMQVRQHKHYGARREINKCKELLRFESESIDFLAAEFLNETDTRGGGLSPRKQMEVFLRFVADPGFQSGIAEDVGVHRTTACKTVSYVMDKIIDRANFWIHFPATVEEINEAKIQWQRNFRLPTVIGALDCTHVQIKKPNLHGDEYVNRKGCITINVQGTCDALERFTSISAEWPGSVHDARIWRRSPVREIMSRFDGRVCLLGDSGYGISPWLITPFKPPTNEAERRFNLCHSRERVVIERCFGQIKRRFPILGNCVRVASEKVPKVVVCCAVLHNIAKYLGDVYDDNFEINGDDEIEEIDVQHENPGTTGRGADKRREMMLFVNQ
ncbi:putative nuclease HARBI1 [Homalodisca vitripennis]|nr:putative nuclease HARBI1 [Homalodisca vitripennis]